MTLFKAVPDSQPSAVPNVIAGNKAQNDATAASHGYGPAEYGGGVSLSQPVPGAPTNSPVSMPAVGVPVTNDDLKTDSRRGAVGRVPGPGEYGLFIPGTAFRGHGAPQGVGAVVQPTSGAYPGSWTDDVGLQTNDLHSQDTDNHGWFQLRPNNRIANWLRFGQSNPINNPTWMGQNENVGSYPLANPGVDYDTFDNSNVGGFQLADGSRGYGFMGDGQNIAYQAPPPPNMTTTDAVTQDSYVLGVDFA